MLHLTRTLYWFLERRLLQVEFFNRISPDQPHQILHLQHWRPMATVLPARAVPQKLPFVLVVARIDGHCREVYYYQSVG